MILLLGDICVFHFRVYSIFICNDLCCRRAYLIIFNHVLTGRMRLNVYVFIIYMIRKVSCFIVRIITSCLFHFYLFFEWGGGGGGVIER